MSTQHKAILIILDGLGDRPIPELDGATPLEAAHTPNFDELAGRSMCGLVDPISPGLPVETTVGTGILMGLAPKAARSLYRGMIEAAGVGLDLQPSDVALRCNFATVQDRADGKLEILDRRAGRIDSGREGLAEALNRIELPTGWSARFKPATQHRAVLVLSGPGLAASITDTDPGYWEPGCQVQPCRSIKADHPGGRQTARILSEYLAQAHELLETHPVNQDRARQGLPIANAILTRGAGKVSQVPNLLHDLEIRASVVAAECTVRGLARLFRFPLHTDPSFTGLADTNLEGKIAATVDALDASDLVFLHIKAPDICAHDHQPKLKRDFLERVDGALRPLLDLDAVLAVTADHSTDCFSGRHTGDPVPALLHSPSGRRDLCDSYGERSCMQGGLGRLTSRGFLTSVLDAMNGPLDSQSWTRKALR